MSSLAQDIWPFLLTALLSAIGLYIGYIHQLKMEMAVMKQTIEDLKVTVSNVQKRQDSHSKKQDDILTSINDMKVEITKQIGKMTNNVTTLSAEVKSMNKLFTISERNLANK